MDPRLKLEYYEEQKWDKRWIAVAKGIALTAYNTSYAPSEEDQPAYLPVGSDDVLNTHLFKKRRVIKKNEIEAYIKAAPADPDTEILEWWKVKYLFFNLILFYYLLIFFFSFIRENFHI